MKQGASSFVLVLVLAAAATVRADGENLLNNGNFEKGLEDWEGIWSRDGSQCAGFELVNKTQSASNVHSGTYAGHITHTCDCDWSVILRQHINVTYESRYEVSYWTRVKDDPTFKIGAIAYNATGSVLSWEISDAQVTSDTNGEWVKVTGHVWITINGTSYIALRCVGEGQGEAYIDDITLKSVGEQPLYIEFSTGKKNSVEARMNTKTGLLNVTLPGTGLRWEQMRKWGPKITDLISYDKSSVTMMISGGFKVTMSLTKGVPEIVYKISSDGNKTLDMYPNPFNSTDGHVVMPVNEGISFPIKSANEIGSKYYTFSSGHGLCMAFWGVVDSTSTGPGYIAIVDTPDDVNFALRNINGLFVPYVSWQLQKGKWGYERVIRYRFFEEGGHVRVAKIFREYRKSQGLLVTLRDKLAKNPSVDLLIGAPNIWTGKNPRTFVPELQSLGIQQILWSNAASAENIDFMNNNVSDVLTSRYDIYQDSMDPNNFQYLSGLHSDWTSEGFPDEITYNSSGDWVRGWGVLGADGKTWYYCGALCDKMALKYARNRTSTELRTKHYKCRFIDTTTASGWRECYHKDHPMTRTESKEWRMKLLDYFSSEQNLVVGSETGHEAAVPYLHYFEGMMSLGPYRVDDAGRNIYDVVYDVPEKITKFQLGHVYRLPLWELVYHDCVVAYWYWGDYNNKLPPVWDKRDLFNALYGVPPMFLINQTGWETYRDRFVQSYNNTVPIARAVGYSEMLSHEFLTEDRDVQQTTFVLDSKHVKRVIVNFATDKPYEHPRTGVTVQPMSYYTFEEEYESAAEMPQAFSFCLCLLFCLFLLF